jgi:hypothetical protein
MKSRLVDNVIVEILQPVVGFKIEDCFHPDLLSRCIDTPDGAVVGWILQEDGTYQDAEGNTVYTPPVVIEPEAAEEPAVEEAVETPVETTEEPLPEEDNGQPAAL